MGYGKSMEIDVSATDWQSWAAEMYQQQPIELGIGMAPVSPYKPLTVPCECGSDKIHGPNGAHSSWCPKHQL